MPNILLVPDLPIEHWPSMDRYAHRLSQALAEVAPDLTISLARAVDALTVEMSQGQIDGGHRLSGPSHPAMLPAFTVDEAKRYFQRFVSYPGHVRHLEADLLHILDQSYAHLIRTKKKVRSIISVHDLLPVLTLQRRSRSIRDRMRNRVLKWVLDNLRKADAFIVATEWLREELATWLGDEERIHVIPYGVDDAFFASPGESREEIRKRWSIPATSFVVLHVGSVAPRKNFGTVIATVEGLRASGLPEAWLLQVGSRLSNEQRLDIDSRNLSDRITSLGPAREYDLRCAYRAADVLLFPSWYEGFGFPVLEAMASELPVVTSSAGGVKEVAGDAASVVAGREVEPYIEAVKQVAGDREYRAELVKRGVPHAKKFRWAEAARNTAALYRDLIGQSAEATTGA